MTATARRRTPIGVQLVLLLGACLLATHLLVFAAIVMMPPPRPPLYRVAEIATALKGGPLSTRFGRPMLRTTAAELPPELRQPREPSRRGDIMVVALAAAVGQAPDAVRLAPRPPSTLERIFHLGGPGTRRIVIEARTGPRHGHGPGRGERRLGPGPGGPPPGEGFGPPAEFRMRHLVESPVFGDFTAALRQADGRWVVVKSSPEPFPTDWQKRALMLLAIGFAVVAPAGIWFARRITAPLKQFSAAAERLGRDPHAEPVVLSGPAEIGAAADAFNGMQARLKRYIDDRTAMVGAISHDLRTPLARIRFKMEAAPADLRGSVLADVGQMEQMINGVLAFIRDQSTPRSRERLDLLSLVECVVDDAALVGGDVEILESAPVTVEGDAVALQRLFVNLVDNAVKYGGQARLRVRKEGDQAVVEVIDAGEGLSPEDLERVFQPFYRADTSRNLDAGGIGLGLPIARSTARAHGGDVELSSTDKGLKARVTLPAAG